METTLIYFVLKSDIPTSLSFMINISVFPHSKHEACVMGKTLAWICLAPDVQRIKLCCVLVAPLLDHRQ